MSGCGSTSGSSRVISDSFIAALDCRDRIDLSSAARLLGGFFSRLSLQLASPKKGISSPLVTINHVRCVDQRPGSRLRPAAAECVIIHGREQLNACLAFVRPCARSEVPEFLGPLVTFGLLTVTMMSTTTTTISLEALIE